MKYKFLLPVLMSVAFLNACSKNESTVETPGDKILETYVPGEALEVKEIAIYTNNQIITDGATIQDFLNRNFNDDVKKNFYLGMTSVPIPASSQVLHILDNNRVNINGVNMQIIGYRDSLMVISEYTSTPIPPINSGCANLVNKVAEYNLYINCPDSSCTTYRKTSPLITNGASYYAPLLTYVVKSGDCATVPSETPMVNIKSYDLQSHLEVKDTVLIQYAKLPLVKQGKN
ncbi:MAG TPA: hypothetical protein VIM79_03435 [Niastella sp.]